MAETEEKEETLSLLEILMRTLYWALDIKEILLLVTEEMAQELKNMGQMVKTY